MRTTLVSGFAVLAAASVALAHGGVKDPGVMARMMAMEEVGGSTKVLRQMAAGKRVFDADVAGRAKADILQHLERSRDLFRVPHDDPKSEALPAIWEDYPGFTAKLDAAILAGAGLDVTDLAGLRATLPAAGQGCLDCHKLYRME